MKLFIYGHSCSVADKNIQDGRYQSPANYLTDFGVLREKTTQNLRYFINSFGYSTIIL